MISMQENAYNLQGKQMFCVVHDWIALKLEVYKRYSSNIDSNKVWIYNVQATTVQ